MNAFNSISFSKSVPITPPPSTPSGFTQLSSTSTSVTISFSMTSEIGTVTYSVNITPTPSPTITYSGTKTSFVINGLSSGSTYNIILTATNSGGSSSPSSSFQITTKGLPNLLLYFDNDLTNSGTSTDITHTSGNPTSYDTTIKKQGTHSGYIQIGTAINYTFTNQTFPRSVAFWMYPKEVVNTHGILSVGDMFFSIEGSGGGNVNNITASPGGLLTFYIKSQNTTAANYYSTAGYQQGSTGIRISVNTWTHIVWVAISSTSWKFYVNNTGYNITANGASALVNTNTLLSIGPGNRNWYNGYLDSLQVWNGYALTATDVNTLYTAP